MMGDNEKPTEVNTGGGAYVGGNVTTGGGSFVGRDQTIHVSATQAGATVAEFAALLAQMRAGLPAVGLDRETAEAVDADFRVVEDQAARDKPNKALILGKLEGAVKVLTAAAGAAAAVEKLLPAAQKAVEMAGQLFR